VPPKVVDMLSPPPRGTSCGKVSWATLTTAKVIGTHMLNFKPICNPFVKNFCGTPSSMEGVLVKTWSFSSARKNLVVQHPLEEQI